MKVWKMIFLFKQVIFRFHGKFQGRMYQVSHFILPISISASHSKNPPAVKQEKPLNSCRNPIGKDRRNQPSFFRGELLNFQGVYSIAISGSVVKYLRFEHPKVMKLWFFDGFPFLKVIFDVSIFQDPWELAIFTIIYLHGKPYISTKCR